MQTLQKRLSIPYPTSIRQQPMRDRIPHSIILHSPEVQIELADHIISTVQNLQQREPAVCRLENPPQFPYRVTPALLPQPLNSSGSFRCPTTDRSDLHPF